MLETVHFLHLVSGVVWAGGTVLFAFVVEPTLSRLDPPQIRAYYAVVPRYAAPVMATSGILLLLTGIVRAVLGGVRSLADLATPYGLLALAALVVVIAVSVYGERDRAAVARLLAGDGDPRPALKARGRAHAIVAGVGVAVTLAIMTMLGLGLY